MIKFLISLVVLLAACVRQTCVSTVAVTGYFAQTRVHQARAIKSICHGNWRYANTNVLEPSFALSQTTVWHTFGHSWGCFRNYGRVVCCPNSRVILTRLKAQIENIKVRISCGAYRNRIRRGSAWSTGLHAIESDQNHSLSVPHHQFKTPLHQCQWKIKRIRKLITHPSTAMSLPVI